MPWFFAYGPEVDPRTMRERAGGWTMAHGGVLRDHRILFDVGGPTGNLPNIRRARGREVHGVLYGVEEATLDRLGVANPAYRWDQVPVHGPGGVEEAWVLLHPGPGQPGAPSPLLLSSLVWALRQRGVPAAYIDAVVAEAKGPRA